MTGSPSHGGKIYPGWKIATLTFLLTLMGSGTVFYAYSVYATSFATAFGAPRTLVNAGFTAVLVASGACSFLVSVMIARLGLATVGVIGCVGTAIGLALVSLTTNMAQVLFLFVTFIALADMLIGSVLCNTLVNAWFESRRGLVMGIMMMGASVAAIVYPPLTSALNDYMGWRNTFLFHAASMLLLVPLVIAWAKLPPDGIPLMERRSPQALDNQADADVPEEELAPASLTSGQILGNPMFWGITIAVGTLTGINGSVLITMVPFAMSEGVERTDAALLISTIGVAAFCGKLGFGLLADRVNLHLVLRGALLLAALAMLILYVSKGFAVWLMTSMLFGLSLGGMLPVWGAIFATLYRRENYPKVIGWSRTLMTPQAVCLPLLAGIIYDLTGDYDRVWLVYLALIMISFACTFLGMRGVIKPPRAIPTTSQR